MKESITIIYTDGSVRNYDIPINEFEVIFADANTEWIRLETDDSLNGKTKHWINCHNIAEIHYIKG